MTTCVLPHVNMNRVIKEEYEEMLSVLEETFFFQKHFLNVRVLIMISDVPLMSVISKPDSRYAVSSLPFRKGNVEPPFTVLYYTLEPI